MTRTKQVALTAALSALALAIVLAVVAVTGAAVVGALPPWAAVVACVAGCGWGWVIGDWMGDVWTVLETE